MKRSILLAALLAFSTAAPTFGKAGASIEAPDGLAFGDSFTPTWTAPTGYEQRGSTYLYATLDCYQDGRHVLGGQYVDLEGFHAANAGPFVLGPNPPYWTDGAASCSIRLLTIDFGAGRERTYATDAFEVAG